MVDNEGSLVYHQKIHYGVKMQPELEYLIWRASQDLDKIMNDLRGEIPSEVLSHLQKATWLLRDMIEEDVEIA